MVKKALIGILAMTVLLVVISELLGWRYLRAPVASLLSSQLGREVVIEKPFRLHLRSDLQLSIGGLSIASPPWSDLPHFVNVGASRVHVGWGVLMGSRLTLSRLELGEGDVQVVRETPERATWIFDEMTTEEPNADADEAAELPLIESIEIAGVTLNVDDAVSEVKMNAQVQTSASDDGQAMLRAKGRGSWQDKPLSFSIEAPKVLNTVSSGSSELIRVQAAAGETKLYITASVGSLEGGDDIKGQVRVEGPSLAAIAMLPNVTLPKTPPFLVESHFSRNGDLIRLEKATAKIGESRLAADLAFQSDRDPPALTGTITASKLVLADLAPAVGAKNDDATPAQSDGKSARVIPDTPFEVPSLRAMNADIKFRLDQLDLGSEALEPIRAVNVDLQLTNGRLSLNNLNASVADGKLSGAIVLDAESSERPPRFESDLRLENVNLGQWLKNEDFFTAGRFTGETALKGRGQSAAEIAGSLTGHFRGSIAQGKVSHVLMEVGGLDVAQAIGVAISDQEPLKLDCAMIDWAFDQGQVQSKLLMLDTVDTLLFVDGGLDLGKESLQLQAVPVPKDWSPASFRAPVLIGGTFSDIDISVKPEPIVIKVLSSLVLGAISPIAAILPLMDFGEADEEAKGCKAAIKLVKEKSKKLQAQ